ncbi:MAG: aspartate kinase [Xylanivirga thermophila]|uniref:aspartate kinase n=1 Tax=Xylanivirga thermophila TaxID=2496273 RepID=UPI00101C1100|nr:aspartate kinase [Xylanivirga thermophila]
MALIVQKFGGSSVADTEKIMNVARRIIDRYDKGDQVVVVVSAQGDTTDRLTEKAFKIHPNPPKREMDMLLSTGEQISIALLAMAIQRLEHKSVSLTGGQVGIKTTNQYSSARIENICCDRLKSELDAGNIVIVAGFQGMDDYSNITTLGRGGSDTTAVALAAALEADVCEIYTDVDGVYTADPRIVPDARKLDTISHDEMLEMASLGARVLHNRAVELAKKYNVNLVVRSSLNNNSGTMVKEVSNMEKMVVKGVAHDYDTAQINVMGVKDEPGMAYRLFRLLADANINVDIIVQGEVKDKKRDISFTVAQHNLEETVAIIESNKEELGIKEFTYSSDVAKVSVIGAGMAENAGIAALMFETLAQEGINIIMITTSEIKISCLIKPNEVEKAVRAIHDKFCLGQE